MRPLAVFVLKLAGAGIAFALLFHMVESRQVLGALERAHLLLVVFGVLVFMAGQVLPAVRWQGILRSQAIDIPLSKTLRINLIGAFVGNFLPGMAVGDLTKSALLFRDFPEKRSFLIASVVYDRLLGLAAIMLLAILGTLFLGTIFEDWAFIPYLAAATLIFVSIIAGFSSTAILGRILRWLPNVLSARCSLFAGELQKLLCAPPLLWRSFGLSLGFQISWVVSQWIMLCALLPHAPFVPVLAASPLSLIVALFPISLNGLGVREGAFTFVLQRFGIEPQVAVAAALLSLVPILVSSVIGGLLLGSNNFLWRSAVSGTVGKSCAP
ncbi:MAG: lysylphosphatidylglycerol synthase transmembrane domain-containing protein [Thermodesulfobacteriota bacterium]